MTNFHRGKEITALEFFSPYQSFAAPTSSQRKGGVFPHETVKKEEVLKDDVRVCKVENHLPLPSGLQHRQEKR